MSAALLPVQAPAALELLLRATLLMVAAWAGAAALRKGGASAAARHTAWLLCVAALLALPVLRWLVPALQLPLLPAEAALPAGPPAPVPVDLAPSAPALTGSLRPNPPEQGGWGFVLLIGYALGAVTLLLRLAAGRRTLARMWRDAEPPADEAWEQLLSSLLHELKLAHRVDLRNARGPAMPMTWGTLAPKLLLPAEASAWPFEQRRLVLLHELAHVARRDSLSRAAASLACALYWFHPGMWLAACQLRIEQEHAADDRVLTAGGSAQAYARSLLHIARQIGDRLQPALAATMGGTCQLERRLVSITSPARRDQPTPAFVSSSVALAAVATLIVAVGAPVRVSATLPSAREAARLLAASTRKGADARGTEGRTGGEAQLPAGPATDSLSGADASGALEGRPAEVDAGSNWRGEGRAATARIEEGEAAGRGETVLVHGKPKSQGEEREAGVQVQSAALSLAHYGWELPRPGGAVQAGSPDGPLPPNRASGPALLRSASVDQIERSKTQRLSRLVLRKGPRHSFPPAVKAAMTMLSWSLYARSN